MIPERTQWTAKSTETGEIIKGYLSFIYVDGKNENGFIYTDKARIYCQDKAQSFDVFTNTLEPVAVAPKDVEIIQSSSKLSLKHGFCPNCNREVSDKRGVAVSYRAVNYCDSCGMRLDWNANAADVERGENK